MIIYESETINFTYTDNNIQLEALQDIIKKENVDGIIASLESFCKDHKTNIIFITDKMSIFKNTHVFTLLINFFKTNRNIINTIYIVSNRNLVISFINKIISVLDDSNIIFVNSLDEIIS